MSYEKNTSMLQKKVPLCTYIGIPIFCIYLLPIYGFLIIVFYSITYTITYKYYINSYSTDS